MNIINNFERKFGRRPIRNLMKYFTAFYIIGFVINMINPRYYAMYLSLEPAKILQGEIWRLFTFLFYPIQSAGLQSGQAAANVWNMFWALIVIWLYYSLGVALENAWGSFRFDLFMFSGVLFHILAAFILYLGFGYTNMGMALTPDHLNRSIFLAFAITYPDIQFYLFFVIPVKAKYLGVFYAIIELLSFVSGSGPLRFIIFFCLLNVILFFLMTRNWKKYSPQEIKRKKDFQNSVKVVPMTQAKTRHRCAVCGRTEKDGDNLEFRYCSKCRGNLEYCQDHLYTHQHVT